MYSEVEYVVAHGIATMIDGKRAVIGSRHFVFEDENVQVPETEKEKFRALDPSCTWLYLAIAGKLAVAIGIFDPLRPEASEAGPISQGKSRTLRLRRRICVNWLFFESLPRD